MRALQLPLHGLMAIAIVPPSLPTSDKVSEPLEVIPVMSQWVRGSLLGIALGLMGVFGIAIWLNPYDPSGRPRMIGTHAQMGLPPCTFLVLTKLPCPSCGMTSSFALLAHGDVWNSLKANAAGTMLALIFLAAIPWCLACVIRGRPYLIWSMEKALTRIVIVFLGFMLARWVIVLSLIWMG